jgi:hypothetical protein
MNAKRISMILILLMGLAGCSGTGFQITNEQAMLTAIELGGYNLGYFVGASKSPADDQAIADAYALARTGTLNPEQVAFAFVTLKAQNPQLTGSLMIILTNMGAGFGPDNNLISLSGIPVAYWDRAAQGYTMGYQMGLTNKKAPVKPSAVKAKIPYVPAK